MRLLGITSAIVLVLGTAAGAAWERHRPTGSEFLRKSNLNLINQLVSARTVAHGQWQT
jgi:hypothetical protein